MAPSVALLLSWYEEQPEWLYELVSSVAGVCDRVVAVDGAYALYPDARARSGPDQADAILFGAAEQGLGVTVHQPRTPWVGNEVEKRRYAHRLAAGADWLLVLDGDERVIERPDDLLERLQVTGCRSATFTHRFSDRPDGCTRKLWRMPVTIGGWHFEYLDEDGKDLNDEEALPLDGLLVVEHRKSDRPAGRQAAADVYYKRRDEQGIETRRDHR